MKLKTPEEVATELWAIQHEGLVKDGVKFPNNFDGIGAAYGGYVRIIEAITQDRQATLAAITEVVGGLKEEINLGQFPPQVDLKERIAFNAGINQTLEALTKLLSPEV